MSYSPGFLSRLLRRLESGLGISVLRIYSRSMPPAPVDSPGTTFRRLSPDELWRYSRDESLDLSPAFLESTLKRRGGCVGAFRDGQLIGYTWFAHENTPYSEEVWVNVPEHAIYRFKALIRPAYRGLRIAPLMYLHGTAAGAAPGKNLAFAAVAMHNRSSMSASRHAGRVTLGYVVMIKKGPLFWAWHSRQVRRLGIRFYKGRRVPAAEC